MDRAISWCVSSVFMCCRHIFRWSSYNEVYGGARKTNAKCERKYNQTQSSRTHSIKCCVLCLSIVWRTSWFVQEIEDQGRNRSSIAYFRRHISNSSSHVFVLAAKNFYFRKLLAKDKNIIIQWSVRMAYLSCGLFGTWHAFGDSGK